MGAEAALVISRKFRTPLSFADALREGSTLQEQRDLVQVHTARPENERFGRAGGLLITTHE